MENRNDKNSEENHPATIVFSIQCHPNPPVDLFRKTDKKRLILASIVCLIIMIIEMIGGILSNSLAVITDSAHLFLDFGAFMVSLLALWISNKSGDQDMNFGYHRAEVIGALISILSVWLITGILLYMAIQRLVHLTYEINSELMLIIAVLAIIANIILAGLLTFNNIFDVCKKGKSVTRKFGINVKSAFIHVVGDLIHGIGVLTASLIIYFKPEFKIADPICTFIFSVIVLCTTIKVMRDILRVLMEGFPSHLTFNDIRNALFCFPEITKVHNLRMWSLTMEKVALAAHIVIRQGENPTEVLKKATSYLSKRFNIYEITLQVEEAAAPLAYNLSEEMKSVSRNN